MWRRVYVMDDGTNTYSNDRLPTRHDAEREYAISRLAVDDFGFIPIRDVYGDVAYINLNHVRYVTFCEYD